MWHGRGEITIANLLAIFYMEKKSEINVLKNRALTSLLLKDVESFWAPKSSSRSTLDVTALIVNV